MTTTKKELSYFRLKLENYLSEHFPEMLSDKPFITARADEALTTYCDAVAQGFSHPRGGDDGKRSSVSRTVFLQVRHACICLRE